MNNRFNSHHPYQPDASYKDMEASSLYCPRCRAAMPLRKRLLLVIPNGEIFEYICAKCATSLGTKTEKGNPTRIIC